MVALTASVRVLHCSTIHATALLGCCPTAMRRCANSIPRPAQAIIERGVRQCSGSQRSRLGRCLRWLVRHALSHTTSIRTRTASGMTHFRPMVPGIRILLTDGAGFIGSACLRTQPYSTIVQQLGPSRKRTFLPRAKTGASSGCLDRNANRYDYQR